ncbi:MAG: uroporphyrinogen decarboxylase family protein [Clostridia bacterium]
MSYADGLAAFNLEMPSSIPRTEYSAQRYWGLIEKVTGIKVDETSTADAKDKASAAFMKAWDFGFVWNVLTHSQDLDKCRTKMGHAVYEQGGTDYNSEVGCPFEDPEDAFDFQPMEVYGKLDHSTLVKNYNENYAKKVALMPDAVNTTGIYITMVSGLLEIFGWDILLMAMGIDAKAFGETTNRYAQWVQQYFNALADCDSPIIKIHDDITWTSGAFAHPDWYREFIFPNYKKLFAPIREAGKKIIFTSDGNFTEFIDDIADCGVNGFVLEPTTDMKYIAENYGKTHSFIGNADTRILLKGTKEDIYNEVKRCIDIGKDCPGFFMAVGNHIPANTPIENALYYNEVFEKLRKR